MKKPKCELKIGCPTCASREEREANKKKLEDKRKQK